MKKLLLIILAALAFTSCNKDEDDVNLIEGRWYLFSLETIRKQAGTTQIDIDTLVEKNQIIEFLPNGVFRMDNNETTYAIDRDSVHVVFRSGQNEDKISFKYVVDNSDLMMSSTEVRSDRTYEDIDRYKRL